MNTDDLLQRYDRNVPRYTSFPTAAQFTPMHAAHYDTRLAQLRGDEAVSLYVHVPFCQSLCHYCGCHTEITHRQQRLTDFAQVLQQEIALVGATIGNKLRAARLHFGGGTPNYLPTSSLEAIMHTLGEHFQLDSRTAIDMECDPRLLTPEKVADYARLGVRRVSLGIQDFDPVVQQAIHRIQPVQQVREAVQWLRDAGITQLNFDLILGLPEQTEASVAATLREVIALRPSRIAVFPYAHVPWMKKQQQLLERYRLPTASERFAMTEQVRETLQNAGYIAIGMDHFALPTDSLARAQQNGTLRRNFQGYTDDSETVLLGFGPSSISQFPDLYVQNTTDMPRYTNAIVNQQLPVARGCAVSEDDQRRRQLIEALLCDFRVECDDSMLHRSAGSLAELEADGLVQRQNNHLQVTERGRPFTRVVASLLDPYYSPASTRHAKAV